ncbi:MAG: hypothetical protein ACRDD1_03135, partial [Planctomycetia bacterium]
VEAERLASPPMGLVVAFGENVLGAGVAANYRLFRDGVDVSSQITAVAYGFNMTTRKFEAALTFAGPLAAGEYRLLVLAGDALVRDRAGNPLDGAADGDGLGEDFQRLFTVAPAVPKGPEFRVNATTATGQRESSVAVDADGDFVVVWTSNQDGSGDGVYAQRYSAAGVPRGVEFLVNTVTAGNQFQPRAAMEANGDFVVVWTSDGQDGSSSGVFAQRFNAAGAPLGMEFQVNTFTTLAQVRPRVAMDADGDFVVVWQSENQDGSSYGVYAQRFNAAGARLGIEFRVNTFTTNFQLQQSVAMDADGDFVVAWVSADQDGSSLGVYAQRYDAVGVPQGSEFRVNTRTTAGQSQPSVAMDADGDFVVVWTSYLQ